MVTINIICTGKIKEKYLKDAIDEYSKRLSKFCKLNILELPDKKIPDKTNSSIENEIKEKMDKSGGIESKDEARIKALARGAFLGSGSVNNPENKYHLEVVLSNNKNASSIKKMLEKMQIDFKALERKNGYSLYMKDGEEISKFLAFIGANNSVLKFEEIRVLREMKNNVNRKVNCETANLNKTINAAVKQIEAIKKLKESGKLESLNPNLKEIASLRVENPDATLTELGQMLQNPIGKSGVNHRLNQLIELSKN